jgi:hypothetical protein
MFNDVKKSDVSPLFAIDDIHKIREYHYKLTKDMTYEERRAFYQAGVLEFNKSAAERRAGIARETKGGTQ